MPRKAVCGNPLFLEWAEAIQQEAEIKQWKAANTYRKACSSIRSCPLPFTKPQDLITLSHVGPAMVKMLEQRQKEHYMNLGLSLPQAPNDAEEGHGSPTEEDGIGFIPRSLKIGSTMTVHTQGARKRKGVSTELEEPEVEDALSPARKKKKTKPAQAKVPKLYVPKTRSGSYAILLALLSNVAEEFRRPFGPVPANLESASEIAEFEDAQQDRLNIALQNAQLTKQETIAAAKVYSDSDFEKSETGGHYTAWSSMKTLLGRGLVCTRGNPARFWLTREGWASASAVKEAASTADEERMASNGRLGPPSISVRPQQLPTQVQVDVRRKNPTFGSLQTGDGSDTFYASSGPLSEPNSSKSQVAPVRTRSSAPAAVVTVRDDPLIFSYLGQGDLPVARLVDAQRSQDQELFLPVRRIRVKAQDLVHTQASRLRNLVQARDVAGGIQFDGWILEANAPEACEALRARVDEPVAYGNSGSASKKCIQDTDVQCIDIDQLGKDAPPPSSSVYADDGFDALISTYVAETEAPLDQVRKLAWSEPVSAGQTSCLMSGEAFPLALPRTAPKMGIDLATGTTDDMPPGAIQIAPQEKEEDEEEEEEEEEVEEEEEKEEEEEEEQEQPEKEKEVAIEEIPRQRGNLVNESLSSLAGAESAVDANRNDPKTFRQSDAIRYDADSYDVILVMDTREIKNRRDEEAICKGLRDHGVRVDVRALKLGDITWVARLKAGKHPHLSGDERECMLDYVVERKRLDDLCSSIRDGRYDDQKYRLTNSSIGHVYYVVENWDIERKPDSTLSLQIATAKSQTQIVSGFFLKETHKLSETIDFLRILTENIVETLKGQDLFLIPERFISRSTYVQLQRQLKSLHPQRPFLISYETYQAINGKNANQTAADVWPKMLLCVKGMSAEKVGAIIKRYPTAAAFWTGFTKSKLKWEQERLSNPGEKIRDLELFFADSVPGDGRQKIGDALSREVSLRDQEYEGPH